MVEQFPKPKPVMSAPFGKFSYLSFNIASSKISNAFLHRNFVYMFPLLLSYPSEHCAHASTAEFLRIFLGVSLIKYGSTIINIEAIITPMLYKISPNMWM